MKLYLILSAFVISSLFNQTFAQSAEIKNPKNDTQKEIVKEETPFAQYARNTLNEMLKTIHEKHFDAKGMEKIDWDSIEKKYSDSVASKTTIESLYQTLAFICESEIKHSHVNIMPPDDAKHIERINQIKGLAQPYVGEKKPETTESTGIPVNPPGDLGIRCAMVENSVRVLRVRPDSPAAKEGILPGATLFQVGRQPIMVSMAPQVPWALIAEMKMSGETGKKCTIGYKNVNGKNTKRNLVREKNGMEWTKFGVMPASAGYIESFILDGNIGYLYFAPCMPKEIIGARKAIRKMAKDGIKGLIIDVRGNPGGLGTMTPAIMGMVTDQELNIVKFINRGSTQDVKSYPQEGAFLGPVALLIDKQSASSSEILAAGLKDNKRATVFGEKTAGACLGSHFLELESGFRLQTVFSDVKRLTGEDIEGIGVPPDFEVKMKVEDAIQGKDSVVEAAKKYLLEKSGK